VTADRLELISILDCRPAPAREELLPLPQSRRRDDE